MRRYTIIPSNKYIGLVESAIRRVKRSKVTYTADYSAWIINEFADVLCIPMTNLINKDALSAEVS